MDMGRVPTTPRRFPKHLVELYDVESVLGRGAFSTVWRAVHRASGEVRAVKKIDTSETSPREIAHEIALMRLLRHECVVRCYDVYIEAQFVNIVVDMFAGGDLVDGLNAHRRARGRVPDHQLARLSAQMAAAVAHVHSLQIVHRDIKGENFLSDRPDIGDSECRVALADFGTAKRIRHGEKITVRVGTPAFWAPEVWAGSYDALVDVWAVGATAFILLTGRLPFDGEADIRRPVADREPAVSMPLYASSGCRDFISRCLTKDPRGRPHASDIAHHEWLSTPAPTPLAGVADLMLRAAPGAEELQETASTALALIFECVGAVALGCFSGLGLCLDIILRSDESAAVQKRVRPIVTKVVSTDRRDFAASPVGASLAAGFAQETERSGSQPPAVHCPSGKLLEHLSTGAMDVELAEDTDASSDLEKEITELSRQITAASTDVSPLRPAADRRAA